MAPMFGGTDADPSDPLFYRGRTPVLGQEVEIAQPAGEITAAFPQASGSAAPNAPTRPAIGPPPTPPAFPDFGEFSFPEWGFDIAPPTMPDRPIQQLEMPTAPKPPWWAAALGAADIAGRGYDAFQRFKGLGAAAGTPLEPWAPNVADLGANDWWVPGSGGQVAGEGFAVNPTTGQLESFGGGEAGFVPGGAAPPGAMTGPTDYGLGMDPGMANANQAYGGAAQAAGINPWALGAGALQLAGGAYGLATGTPDQKALGAAGTVGGAASLLNTLGVGGGALAGVNPVMGAIALPMIIGSLYKGFFGPDRAQLPQDRFTFLPGSSNQSGPGAQYVDRQTGAILEYKGNGQYKYAPQTMQGKPFTPQQFEQFGMEPGGDLLKRPEYAGVQQRMAQARSAAAAFPGMDTTGAQQFYDARAAQIRALQAASPGASEGEIWRQYTITPEAQQEQQRQQQAAYQGPMATPEQEAETRRQQELYQSGARGYG